MQKRLHWSKVFTARLSEDVKLVGSTISCEPAYLRGNPSNEARHTAHVQSYVIATDQVSYAPFHSCASPLLRCRTTPYGKTSHMKCITHRRLQQCMLRGTMNGNILVGLRWLMKLLRNTLT